MKQVYSYLLLFSVVVLVLTGIGTYIGKTATGALVKNITGKDIPSSYYTTRYWFGKEMPDTRYERGKQLLGQE